MISKKIKALREHNNYTQDDLALACNVSRSAISNYENNRRQPNPEVVKTIACVFGVTIEELLNNDISIEQILNGPEPSMSFDTNIDDDHVVVGNKRFASVVHVLNAVTTLIVTICLLMVLIPAIKDNKFSDFNKEITNIESVTLQLSNSYEIFEYKMEKYEGEKNNSTCFEVLVDTKYVFANDRLYYFTNAIKTNILVNGNKKLKNILLANSDNNRIYHNYFFGLELNEPHIYNFIFYYEGKDYYLGAFIVE